MKVAPTFLCSSIFPFPSSNHTPFGKSCEAFPTNKYIRFSKFDSYTGEYGIDFEVNLRYFHGKRLINIVNSR